MEEYARSLSFNVTGEFITTTARDWFWYEHKPWSVVEEFLLRCMYGTDQTEEDLKRLAQDVVFGRAKFTGNTADGSYVLVDDDQNLVVKNVERLTSKLKAAEKSQKDIQDRYLTLADGLVDEGYDWLLNRLTREYREPESCLPVMSAMVSSYIEQSMIEKDYNDNYGWLEPDGTFHPVEFTEHQGWAFNYIETNPVLYKEYREWNRIPTMSDRAGDFLTARGWVLLHNPGRGVAQVTKDDSKPLTKHQKEFLFGYYSDRRLDNKAQEFIED